MLSLCGKDSVKPQSIVLIYKPHPQYITDLIAEGKEHRKTNIAFLKKAKIKKGVERLLPDLHDEAFEKVNCLDCGNCCRSISPRFKTPDIKKISKFLGIKESDLIHEYLRLDNDGDYVVKTTPCPFLNFDNTCEIYEVRPGDCANYPYTDSGDFFKYPNTTAENTLVCPAVNVVMEKLRSIKL